MRAHPSWQRTGLALAALLALSASLYACALGLPVRTTPNDTPSASACRPIVAAADASHPPSGRIAFAAGDDFDIWVINAEGSGLRQLTNNPGPEFDPAWSPDGGRIVYRDSRRGINIDDEIYVMNADGSAQTNLTRNPADDWGPAWSPNGAWIAFSSTRDGLPNIYIMRPDGSNLTRLSSDEGEYPSWSPDSQRIVYASAQGSQYDLFVVTLDGKERTRLSENAVRDMFPAWAPDARSIAYQTGRDFPPPTEEETQSEVHVMRADGSCDLRLTENATDDAAPAWSRDGRYIVWEEHAELMIMAADGSGVRHLTAGHFPDWTY